MEDQHQGTGAEAGTGSAVAAERVSSVATGPMWPRLSATEHGDLRRVRAIIRRLHHREPDEWGEPLDGCLLVLAKVIDGTDPNGGTP